MCSESSLTRYGAEVFDDLDTYLEGPCLDLVYIISYGRNRKPIMWEASGSFKGDAGSSMLNRQEIVP